MFALHGMEPGLVVPTAALFLRHVHPDDRVLVEQVMETCTADGRAAGCEYRLVDLTGHERTVALAVSVESEGTIVGLVVDVTESRSRVVARAVNDQLTQALESRAVIDQAKGILMASLGIDSDRAFTALSVLSQRQNVRLRLLADDVVRMVVTEGTLRPATLAELRQTLLDQAERIAPPDPARVLGSR